MDLIGVVWVYSLAEYKLIYLQNLDFKQLTRQAYSLAYSVFYVGNRIWIIDLASVKILTCKLLTNVYVPLE